MECFERITEIYKQSGSYKGGRIRLISCEAAAEGAYTAQRFADEMRVEILAPADIKSIFPQNVLFVIAPRNIKINEIVTVIVNT